MIGLVGQPFVRDATAEEGETWMRYIGLKGMEGSHYIRIVILGKGGRVTRVIADFIDVGWW